MILLGMGLLAAAQCFCLSSPAQIQPVPLSSIPASLLVQARQHPQALMRTVVQTELSQNSGQRPRLQYRLHKITRHLDITKEIIETNDGDVACLVATAGHPLTADEWTAERARLEQLSANPALEKHRQRREQADIQRFNQILRALPDAFLFTFVDAVPTPDGPALRMSFQPNPHYAPTSYETRVLRVLRGELWINANQMRVQSFHAYQFQPISFGWGLLGRLDNDGSIHLTQSAVLPQVWDFTQLHMSFTGRAVVKSLQIHVDETASDYSRVNPTLTYQQAIDLLLRDHCNAAQ